jgi:autotransporter-associated beta strand protein
MKNRFVPLCPIVASIYLVLPAHAVSYFWDGTSTTTAANGGNGNWDTTTTNWDTLATAGADIAWPTSGTDNDAVFGGTAGTVTIATGGVTANDLTFGTTGYTIGGAGLTLNGTLPVISVTGTATINSSITTAVAGGFSKTGTGTLILGAANSFAANTTLLFATNGGNLGAIRLAHSNALSGITLINGVPTSGAASQARIELTGGITVSGTEVRTGGRANSQTTGSTLVNISGDNTWAGAVRIYSTGGGHGIRSDAGTLTISGGVNSNIGARTWEIGGAGNVTITGAVTTAVGITKFGAGTLTLSSSGNTYTGDTKSGAGSLVINHANALSGSALDMATTDTGTVSFGPTITAATLGSLKGSRNLSLNNTAAVPAAVTLTVGANNATNTYTGQFSGSGHLYKSGTGTQTLDPGSAASISIGSLSANGGSLILKSGTFANTAKDPLGSLAAYNVGAGARGGTLTIDGATLNVGSGNNLKIAATTSGTLSILSGAVTSNDMVIGHNGAGTATQSGGTATVTNLYHQDGGVGSSYTLTGGSLIAKRIFNNAATGDFTFNLNGGTLNSAASTTNLIDTQGAGAQISVLLGAGNTNIDTTASSASIVRPMGNMASAVGTFTKAGTNTLTLTATNTYTGATTITGGTLALTGTGSISASSAIIVGASTTFDVSGVTGGYTLGSTQTISGAGTVAGAMTVAGTLSPGNSPGSLATASQTWVNGGDFNWQILDATGAAGTGFDTMAITGSLDLTNLTTGGFNINLWSLSSTAPDVNGDALNFSTTTNYSWILASTTTGITGFDATNFILNVGTNNGTSGFSNALDGGAFTISQSGNSLLLNYTAVPEPSVAVLSGMGLLALLRRRRR